MIDIIIETLAKWFDAVVRGVGWGLTIGVCWIVFYPVLRYLPRAIKAMGVW
jgi:hypothetical protein